MQSQNGMGGAPAPMKRIRHQTTIEEPGGFQTGPGMGTGGMSPGAGFLQNMVHPAFRNMTPGAGMAPPMSNPGLASMPSMPQSPFAAGPAQFQGYKPMPPSGPPNQVGLSPMEMARRRMMLMPFFQRLFGMGG